MSIRPSYGSYRVRQKARRSPVAEEAVWPSWRDMRPVLLKSAGIVGLAGAIMAIVSGNALLSDPGGPARDVQASATVLESEALRPVAIVQPAGEIAPAELAAPATAAVESGAQAPEPAVIIVDTQPQTTASIAPSAAAAAPAGPPADIGMRASVEAHPQDGGALFPGVPAEPPPARSPDHATGAGRQDHTAALWPAESVACPRDWVSVGTEQLRGSSARADCRDAEPLVQQASERSPATLAAKLPPHVLELTALAPPIPVPDPNAKPQPQAAEEKPAEKPKRVRSAAHRADWPDEPPPDCGSKHARWRFTDRKAGTKEWYCK